MSDLSGREIEFFETSKAIAAADNRAELLQRQREADIRRNNQEHLAELTSMYSESGLPEMMEQLSDILGSRLGLDRDNCLLGHNSMFGWMADLERPVHMGARRATIDWAANHDNPTDVLAMHGEVVFYRTVAEKPQSYDDGDYAEANYITVPTKYNEKGFFCLFIQPRPTEYESAAPLLCFGDLDTAQWQSEQQKLLLPLLFGKDETLTRDRPVDVEANDFLRSLTTQFEQRGGLFRRKRVYKGVLLQNAQPWMPEAKDVTQEQVKEAMQQFVTAWYDPAQTNEGFQKQIEAAIPVAQQEFLETPHELTTFDVVKAIARYAPDRKGKIRPLEIIQPVGNSRWSWNDYQRRLNEYPLYKTIHKMLRSQQEQAFAEACREGNFSNFYDYLSVYDYLSGRDDLDYRTKQKILEKFNTWDGDIPKRAKQILDGLLSEDAPT